MSLTGGSTSSKVYFDKVQVIEGYQGNEMNLLSDGSFESGSSSWTFSSNALVDSIDSITSGIYEDILGNL